MSGHDVLITGIGLLSCLGEGVEKHWNAFSSAHPHIVDTQTFAPYSVHPLPPEIDWGLQIPRKEQRQMEQWQRIGTYTAGLALQDAGIKDNEQLTASMDMIVAAGGGERDVSVDTQILDAARTRNDREVLLNEKLTTELRPTLFLAQLSNLLAGNISIVHKVTGSSRTFMGEEGAGISALQTGLARIRSGQSTHLLLGGALNAEHLDVMLSYELNGHLARSGWSPLWQRGPDSGGVVLGSGAAFLVLESREHATKRGARAYAQLVTVSGNQASRKGTTLQTSIEQCLSDVGSTGADLVISGASGAQVATAAEMQALEKPGLEKPGLEKPGLEKPRLEKPALEKRGLEKPGLEKPGLEKRGLGIHNDITVRAFTGLTGHMKEAQFPFAVALAALAVSRGETLAPIDPSFETAQNTIAETAIALTVGYHRGEGAALLKKA